MSPLPPNFGKKIPTKNDFGALGVLETSTLKVDIQDMGGGLDVLDDLKFVETLGIQMRIPDVGM